MGSRVNICSVNVLNNPSTFLSDFNLEITFEMFENLPRDLEWELVYVGSAESSALDQVLDSVEMGPIPEGRHKFTFTANAPNVDKIPQQDIVGVTVLLLRCKYDGQEFINLGWYVSNEYEDAELKENPPANPILDKLVRTVQIDDLRVTTFAIKWDDNQVEEFPPEISEAEAEQQELMPEEDDGQVDEEEQEEAEAVEGEAAQGDPLAVEDLEDSMEGVEVDTSAANLDATKMDSSECVVEMPQGEEETENKKKEEESVDTLLNKDGGDAVTAAALGDVTNEAMIA